MINGSFVEKHTSDDSGNLVTINGLNSWVDAVTNKVFSILALDGVEPGEVNLRKTEVALGLLLLHLLGVLLLRHVTHLAPFVSSLSSLRCALSTGSFVIAILLRVLLMTWVVVWVLLAISTAHVLVMATFALPSTAPSVASSTSVVIFVLLEITSHILLGSPLIPLH